jgi:hypothetical protein
MTTAVVLAAGIMLSAGAGATVAAPASVPTASTGSVVSVMPTTAMVRGTVDPDGSATTWTFQYALSTSATYTSSTAVTSAGAGTTDVPVTASLTGLAPATSYHYRIVAVNKLGTTDGVAGLVNTSAAPAVVTGDASSLTAASATLNGVVNPEGLATSWYFEYGPSTSYGWKTPATSMTAGPNDTNVSYGLLSLAPQTTYHFRIVATSYAGTSLGVDLTFITGLSVTLNTSLSTIVYGRSVELSGAVTDGLAGENVTIETEPYNQTAFSGVAAVVTGAGGDWTYSAQPTVRTTFEANADGGTSSPVVISVRPKVFLSVNSSGVLSTRVIGGVTFASHVLQLQRLSGGLWVTWKHVRLNDNADASFVTSLPLGRTMIRMAIGPFVIGVDQAAPGYLAGYSHAISYNRS